MKSENDLPLHMHDLKNMLTVLLGNLELFTLERVEMQEKEEIAQNLREVIPMISSQIELFLHDNRKTATETSSSNFSEVLEEVVGFWKKMSLYRKTIWDISIAPGLMVKTPGCAIKTLGHNIISNALKHGAPRKGITVKVTREGNTIVWETSNHLASDARPKSESQGQFGIDMARSIAANIGGSMRIEEKEHVYAVLLYLPILEKF